MDGSVADKSPPNTTHVGRLWVLLNSPLAIALCTIAATWVFGTAITNGLKEHETQKLQRTAANNAEILDATRIRDLIIKALTRHYTYASLIRDELLGARAADDLSHDWSIYKSSYVDTAISIRVGRLALNKALSPLGPRVQSVFNNYMTGKVEGGLRFEYNCLSWARDAYEETPSEKNGSNRARAIIESCNVDNTEYCLEDLTRNIDDAVQQSKQVHNLSDIEKSRLGICTAKFAKDCVSDRRAASYVRELEDECGPEPLEG